jgi:16S rRNA (uracil1498-N3)-methyltransferase
LPKRFEMNMFYITESPAEGDEIVLSEEESRHAISVMRKKVGDRLSLADGKGIHYESDIIKADHYACRVKIVHAIPFPERPFKLIMAVAPTKNIDRFEWFLEKAVEIGVEEIYPLGCRNNERTRVNQERLERVVLSAFKQSLNMYLPVLHPYTPLERLVKTNFEGQKLIAHNEYLPEHMLSGTGAPTIMQLYQKGNNAMILIGPEGDFSLEEVKLCKENGFVVTSLGPSRLRTETAGVVACNAVSLMNL